VVAHQDVATFECEVKGAAGEAPTQAIAERSVIS